MFEAAIKGFLEIFILEAVLYLLLGNVIGFIFGAIPGISGLLALALLIPLTVKMDPICALALVIGAHVAAENGGSISSILIGTPGTGQAVATVFDGYPMAKKGESARAISAAGFSSFWGGFVGFAFLVACIPIMRPLLFALSPPEYFIMVFVGLSFIALLGEGSMWKGLVAGGLGLMVSMIGVDPITSLPRFTFGWLFLWDGIDVIPMIVGMFAFAEMIDLARKGFSSSISSKEVTFNTSLSQIWQGCLDCIKYWKTTLYCSVLGVVVGIVPGLGGAIANVMAYGLGQRLSKKPEMFGHGTVEGVIAPESANNSKEGGVLIPTIAFGIPGSAAGALYIVFFMMLGMVPGPSMLGEHLHMTFSIAWIILIANFGALLLSVISAAGLARLSLIPIKYIIPVVISIGAVGCYVDANDVGGVILAAIFAIVGFLFKSFGYPRAPFLIGMILGSVVERYLHMSIQLYGNLFFLRPISLSLIIIFTGVFVYSLLKKKRSPGDSLNV